MEAAGAFTSVPDRSAPLHAVADRRLPTRAEIECAATSLIERRGGEVLRHAQRFTLRAEDAEDAYQRGLEILLTKAPTTDEEELVAWLKTVVMREAFAIKKRAARAGSSSEIVLDRATTGPGPQDQLERYERLRVGAEAMSRLKPHEIQALLMRAEGHTYAEIQTVTGWTHTKVNRLLSEGRRSFLGHVEGIESGADCARFEPLMSAFADGESDAGQVLTLRRHLRSCSGCRAALRRYHSAPRELAALTGPIALAAGSSGRSGQRVLDQLQAWVGDRATLIALKAHGALELSTGSKLLAVAASSAALAGGGAAVNSAGADDPNDGERSTRTARHDRSRKATTAVVKATEPAAEVAAVWSSTGTQRAGRDHGRDRNLDRDTTSDTEVEPHQAVVESAASEPAAVAGEFDPSAGSVATSGGAGSGSDGGGGGSGGKGGSGGDSRGSGGGGGSGDGEFAP